MLRFSLFGFPIVIHWIFWVNCALLGGAIDPNKPNSPEHFQQLMAWVVVVFSSVLIHELGHAFTMRFYGDKQVGIMLYAFGGLAQGSRWRSRTEDFFVSAAGPFVQIVAALLLWALVRVWQPTHWLVAYMVTQFIFASLFWAVLNLLPIIPLDGGHISLALFGPRRQKIAIIISLICAVAVAVLAIMTTNIFAILLFGMMAFNNFKQLRGEPQTPWMAGR